MADAFYTAILPFALGGMIMTMHDGKIAHALGAGIALAVLWFTREESALLVLPRR